MPAIAFSTDGYPIVPVRPYARTTPDTPATPAGYRIEFVRIVSGVFGPSGRYAETVRIESTAVDVPFNADGYPIRPVTIAGSSDSTTIFTPDGYPINNVRVVDASGVPVTGDPDVLAWKFVVEALGGTVSAQRVTDMSTFVAAEKAAGIWALTEDYNHWWGENAIQSLVSLKLRKLAVPVNSPTFTASRGYAFDGVTQYIDTLFSPVNSTLMGINDNRLAVYERTNVTGNTYSFAGSSSSSLTAQQIRTRNASTFIVSACCQPATFSLPSADSRGFTAGSRNGAAAANILAHKNGVAMTRTIDPAGFGTSLHNRTQYVGGSNTNGVLTLPKAASIGLTLIGRALTTPQELAQYTNVQALATSIGANV